MAEKEIILQGEDGQVDELVLTTTDASTDIALDDCTRLLFPQEGEAVPRLRFRGFEEKWIEAKLGDLFTERLESDVDGEMLSVTMNNGVIKASDNGRFDNSNSDKSHYKVVKVNDIAYNTMRMWQGASGCSAYEGIVSPAYTVVTPVEGIDPHFFACLFKTPAVVKKFRLNSQGLTSDTWNLKFPAFCKISVLYPKDIEEQRKIASFLQRLDEQVKHYQDQFDQLKQLKSACLETMFPRFNESMPCVRFEGFDDAWKVVPLSDCLSVNTEKNLEGKYGREDVLSVSDDFGVVNQIKLLGRSFAGKSVLNYRVLKHGDIVYTKSPLKVKPFGIIKVNDGESGIVSTLYAVYTPKEGVSARFINYYFAPAQRMNKYIHPLVNKGAKNDMKVSDENVLKGTISIPTTIEEQEQIAQFFSDLDGRILVQKQQLERLKQMKQSCLGLLFADNQSITPPLRFKGFNGEWIMIRFSDIATIRRGLTYSPENIRDRGVRVLRSSNIDEDAFTISDSDVFVDSRCVNIPLANNGDILVTAANGSPRLVGKHCLVESDDEKMVPGGFMYLVSSDEAEFLNACMGASWYKKFLVTGVSGGNGAIGNLSKDELEKCEFYIPKEKEERNRIASFFTNLDKQITLQSQQVEKLMQLKKACLNQFIA